MPADAGHRAGRGRASRPRARRALRAVLALGVAAAALSGCVVSRQEPGQATAAVADALGAAGSAAETTRTTVELLDRGRVTGPVADTALLDQLRVLDDAELALVTLVPPDTHSADRRAAGLAAVGDVTDTVVAAREWVAARSGGDVVPPGAVPVTADALLAELGTVAAAVDDALAAAGGP